MTHPNALPEPTTFDPDVSDPSILEIARVWLNKGQPAIIVRPAFNDPRGMGQMLAELCWHFAYAYEQRGGVTHDEALEAMRAGWIEGHANGEAARAKSAP